MFVAAIIGWIVLIISAYMGGRSAIAAMRGHYPWDWTLFNFGLVVTFYYRDAYVLEFRVSPSKYYVLCKFGDNWVVRADEISSDN